ncbi:MAG: response regulator [Rhodocyclaceae bacterium]|nr:response regulator [Rhodocyclaceae bacterium]
MGQKVLIVDDHADIRRLVRLTLGKSYEVFEAEDGVTALETAQRERPAVVVLDVMMPGALDGFQVLKAIKSDPDLKSTKVIMATARGQFEDYKTGKSMGADEYVIKPFSPIRLAGMIKEFVG